MGGFNHNTPLAKIASEEGQIQALALAVAFIKTLSDFLGNKEGVGKISEMLAGFEQKHLAYQDTLKEHQDILLQIQSAHSALDEKGRQLEIDHQMKLDELVVKTASLQNEAKISVQKFQDDAMQDIKARQKKLLEAENDFADRKGSLDARERQMDSREAKLNEIDDMVASKERTIDSRSLALAQWEAKLDARHDEITKAEKNALKG